MEVMNILILEDEDLQREVIVDELARRGFSVMGAKTSSEALELAERLNGKLALAILDMRLEGESITGAEVGIQIRERLKHDPPEFLISSCYAKFDYYETALRLGTAAYLPKRGELGELIRHVRALYLRRLIGSERPEESARLRRIAMSSRSRLQDIIYFCKTVLQEALNEVLGAPYVLLLSGSDGRTSCCGGNAEGLPLSTFHPDYNTVAALTFGMADAYRPFVMEANVASKLLHDADIARLLYGSAFLTLAEDLDFRLCLGILRSEPTSLAEDPQGLAGVLIRYLRGTLYRQIFRLLALSSQFDELRKVLPLATAKLCLYLGQDLMTILEQGGAVSEFGAPYFQKLRALGENLSNTGSFWESLFDEKGTDAVGAQFSVEQVAGAGLIRLAWEKVAVASKQDPASLEIEGDCTVVGSVDAIYFATSCLLQWLADRMVETRNDVGPAVRVSCSETDDGPTIIFEDSSQRLDGQVRSELFRPLLLASWRPLTHREMNGPTFCIGIYLAKMLTELGGIGSLEDRSDELEAPYGHRLILRLSPGIT